MIKLNHFENKINFYKIPFNYLNRTKKNFRSGLSSSNHKILRFRKTIKKNRFVDLCDFASTNFNLVQVKANVSYKLNSIKCWVKLENFCFLEKQFNYNYQKILWGANLLKQNYKFQKTLNFFWFKPVASLIFCLRFMFKALQLYFLKPQNFSLNSLILAPFYWKSFQFFKTPLSSMNLGNNIIQGERGNFKFSLQPLKESTLLDIKGDFLLITLPSLKSVWLKKKSTFGVLKNNHFKNLVFNKKASSRFLIGRKSVVRGKAMNVFNRPNGGFKHSSKLLKTFKGKKILK